jgi:hypothetical protein
MSWRRKRSGEEWSVRRGREKERKLRRWRERERRPGADERKKREARVLASHELT